MERFEVSDAEGPWRPRRQWRRHRYYKVQYFEQRSQSWRDYKPAFDKLSEAELFIKEECAGKHVRIMWVEGKKRGPLQEFGP